MNMIPAIEKDSLEQIKNFQEQKLTELLQYISQHSPFYKRLFAGQNIAISKIKTLEDLQHLPVTTKEDLQQYNDDFLCVP